MEVKDLDTVVEISSLHQLVSHLALGDMTSSPVPYSHCIVHSPRIHWVHYVGSILSSTQWGRNELWV